MVKKRILMMAAVLCCTVSIEAQTSFQETKMSSWLHQHYLQEQQAIKKNGGPRRVEGRPVKNYMLTLVKSGSSSLVFRGDRDGFPDP